MKSKHLYLILLGLFILGAILRAINLWHPIDLPFWREADLASIARNYYREGMNLFYPRIDWRGNTPGYAEMEFPIYPWLVAVLFKIFGYHEIFHRILAYLFSLGAMGSFFLLAQYLLPNALSIIIACLFFILSPLAIQISTSIKPEGLMFFCYILAAYAFLKWLDTKNCKFYTITAFASALTILAKASAAHIGLFFALVLWNRQNWHFLKSFKLWLLVIFILLPGILWYEHAHTFWLTYGNSLGISNETHFLGWDLLKKSEFIRSIVQKDTLYAWMPTGIIVCTIGVFLKRYHLAVQYSLYWFFAVFIFYLLAGRTTGDEWAIYYHVFSIPPISILFGISAASIYDMKEKLSIKFLLLFISLGFGLGFFSFHLFKKITVLLYSIFTLVLFLSYVLNVQASSIYKKQSLSLNKIISGVLIMGLFATFSAQSHLIIQDIKDQSLKPKTAYQCAQEFKPLLPQNELILVSGGMCKDETGYPVAYNASYMFYWLDLKGFNICHEDQSLSKVQEFKAQGAKYFIAEKSALNEKKNFEHELKQNFSLIQECETSFLFDLQ